MIIILFYIFVLCFFLFLQSMSVNVAISNSDPQLFQQNVTVHSILFARDWRLVYVHQANLG